LTGPLVGASIGRFPRRSTLTGSGVNEVRRAAPRRIAPDIFMVELLRTNNPVLISFLTAFLADQDVETFVFDAHASVVEGSIAAIQRRIMVADEDLPRAKLLLEDARATIPGV
jgi:hypothetical protein